MERESETSSHNHFQRPEDIIKKIFEPVESLIPQKLPSPEISDREHDMLKKRVKMWRYLFSDRDLISTFHFEREVDEGGDNPVLNLFNLFFLDLELLSDLGYPEQIIKALGGAEKANILPILSASNYDDVSHPTLTSLKAIIYKGLSIKKNESGIYEQAKALESERERLLTNYLNSLPVVRNLYDIEMDRKERKKGGGDYYSKLIELIKRAYLIRIGMIRQILTETSTPQIRNHFLRQARFFVDGYLEIIKEEEAIQKFIEGVNDLERKLEDIKEKEKKQKGLEPETQRATSPNNPEKTEGDHSLGTPLVEIIDESPSEPEGSQESDLVEVIGDAPPKPKTASTSDLVEIID